LAAIIGFFQWKNRASQPFEDPGYWRRKQPAATSVAKIRHTAKPDPLDDDAHPEKPAKRCL